MPSWVVGVAVTLALSLISAYGFLLLRCRGSGHPFGPHSRPWAITVVLITAAISTLLGVAAVAVGHHVRAAYIALLVPSVLWLGKASAQRRRRSGRLVPRQLAGHVMLPLRRLDDGMGDDLQDWCDARSRAVSGRPQQVADAAQCRTRASTTPAIRRGLPGGCRARRRTSCTSCWPGPTGAGITSC